MLRRSASALGRLGVPIAYAISREDRAIRWKVNVGVGYAFLAHARRVAISNDSVDAEVERDINLNGSNGSGVLVLFDRLDGYELWRYETPPSTARHFFLGAPVPPGPCSWPSSAAAT